MKVEYQHIPQQHARRALFLVVVLFVAVTAAVLVWSSPNERDQRLEGLDLVQRQKDSAYAQDQHILQPDVMPKQRDRKKRSSDSVSKSRGDANVRRKGSYMLVERPKRNRRGYQFVTKQFRGRACWNGIDLKHFICESGWETSVRITRRKRLRPKKIQLLVAETTNGKTLFFIYNPRGCPSPKPTTSPTPGPSGDPTRSPTRSPTQSPTRNPTQSPTKFPSKSPTKYPSKNPSVVPTQHPTKAPATGNPTTQPTQSPTTIYQSGQLVRVYGRVDRRNGILPVGNPLTFGKLKYVLQNVDCQNISVMLRYIPSTAPMALSFKSYFRAMRCYSSSNVIMITGPNFQDLCNAEREQTNTLRIFPDNSIDIDHLRTAGWRVGFASLVIHQTNWFTQRVTFPLTLPHDVEDATDKIGQCPDVQVREYVFKTLWCARWKNEILYYMMSKRGDTVLTIILRQGNIFQCELSKPHSGRCRFENWIVGQNQKFPGTEILGALCSHVDISLLV